MTDKSATRGLRLCLAASGGGHVRQLLDLEPLWRDYDHFFVTEDTALGRSIATSHATEFVPHFAVGQARLGNPLKMLWEAGRSLLQSYRIIARRRPDAVITTGAGSQLFVVAWARLRGAQIILIDSFARFDKPSKFARLAGPLAHHRIAQSAQSAQHWPGAEVFDPLRQVGNRGGEKEELLFATVGATLPFERLTQWVVAAKRSGAISERVILQAGKGANLPTPVEGLTMIEEMSFEHVKETLSQAKIVVCHGGTGSIITALQYGCATIVLPRRFELGEHYDNHQAEISGTFVERGLVLSAGSEAEFVQALEQARAFVPQPVTTDYTALIARLRELLRDTAQ